MKRPGPPQVEPVSEAAAATCHRCVRAPGCAVQALATDIGTPPVEFGVPMGAPLVDQNVCPEGVVAIKLGQALVERELANGSRTAVGVLGPGHVLGLRALLPEAAAASCAVRALSPMRVCVLPLSAGRAAPPRLSPAVLLSGVTLADALTHWAAIARLPSAQQRLEAVLQTLADTEGRAEWRLPSRAVLAHLALCAPETVSRLLTRWQREGRLQRGPRRMVRWGPTGR